jgi:citrate synthase
MASRPTTALCHHNEKQLFYRDKDLVADLIGKRSFADVMMRQITGRDFSPAELDLIDAILVTLMEHGLTPSAISTRLTIMSAPEAVQGAIAAGLLNAGNQFLGSMHDCAVLLAEIVANGDDTAAAIAARFRAQKAFVPGFGHNLHKPDDPRAIALQAMAAKNGIAGKNVAALDALAVEVRKAAGKHVTINATGAIAAILGDLKIPIVAMRGLAVVARAAGLVAHIVEETQRPSARFIWTLVDKSVPFSLDEGSK